MSLDEERLIRLRQQRSKEAIDLAMQGRWREAVEVNQRIIEDFPRDVEAYNRLGRACMELGDYSQAREAYSRTVELDSFNAIANKNLQRLSYLKEAEASTEGDTDTVEPRHFIQEIGKSGVVNLYGEVPKEVLARTVAGDKVYFRIEGTNLIAENSRGEYLGQVELKHAQRLIKLMEGGNRYTAAVVSITGDIITIIIREVYQDPSQVGRLSFPPKGLGEVRPYVSDRILKVDEEAAEESGYTIIGGEEIEVLPGESDDGDEDTVSDED